MIKCSPCKWVWQICMKYKFRNLDRFLKEHIVQHGRAQVVSPSSFWMFPKFEDQFIPHSQLARRMGLLQQEVLDEASCIVATFKILEIDFITQGHYDYNERCLNFFDCTDLCSPPTQPVKQVLIQILPATSGIKLHLQPSHLPSYLCGRGGYA